MRVKFVDLRRQLDNIRDEIVAAIGEVLDSTAFSLGFAAERFEKSFADYIGVRHCLGCGSGTDALVLALRALDIGLSDEVIVPANTFIATAEAVRLVGAKPVFVDPEELTYLIGAETAEAAITELTKAFIPVHLYGRVADMDSIMSVAHNHGLKVIEDAAQAHGASYRGRKAGSMGDIGCFSFYPGKNLGAYGEGGAVVTNDDEIAEKIAMMRDHGSKNKYFHYVDGYNSRLDGFQAAVLNVKLNHLESWNAARRERAKQYIDELSGVSNLILPTTDDPDEAVWHLFVVRVPQRDAVREKLGELGIDTGIHYPIPLHEQPVYKDLGYKPEDLPVAHRCAPELLSLPIFPELTQDECSYVCDSVKSVLRDLM